MIELWRLRSDLFWFPAGHICAYHTICLQQQWLAKSSWRSSLGLQPFWIAQLSMSTLTASSQRRANFCRPLWRNPIMLPVARPIPSGNIHLNLSAPSFTARAVGLPDSSKRPQLQSSWQRCRSDCHLVNSPNLSYPPSALLLGRPPILTKRGTVRYLIPDQTRKTQIKERRTSALAVSRTPTEPTREGQPPSFPCYSGLC